MSQDIVVGPGAGPFPTTANTGEKQNGKALKKLS